MYYVLNCDIFILYVDTIIFHFISDTETIALFLHYLHFLLLVLILVQWDSHV